MRVGGLRAFPPFLYAAAFLSFSPLTSFDCERRREETEWKGGQEVPVVSCSALCVSPFFLEEGRQEKKERRGGGGTFAGLSGIISQPSSDLRRTVHSPSS